MRASWKRSPGGATPEKFPCVRFEIESDSLDMLSTNDSMANNDPYVRMHFGVATAGRVFTKAGLVAIVKLFLNHLWDITLSPWEVSAGLLPFSLAHHLLGPVFEIYNTGEMTSEHLLMRLFQQATRDCGQPSAGAIERSPAPRIRL
jgi:hypothetical protein